MRATLPSIDLSDFGKPASFSSWIKGGWLLLIGVLILVFSTDARAQFIGPLRINPISNTSVEVGELLTLTVSVTNTVPSNRLLWSISSGPAGVSITNSTLANSALLTWRPASNQGPSTNNITVQVTDFLDPTNVTSSGFTVVVFTNAVDSPPELDPIEDQTVAAGQLLTVTATARTTDGTANLLVFSLEDPPAGASINPVTGVFTWQPTPEQADFYPITVIVTEQGTSLSDMQIFIVNVILTNSCESFDSFVAAIAQGGVVELTNCPTIVLSNTVEIANDVTLEAGTNSVVITGNNLGRLFTVLSNGNLTLNGVTLSGGLSTNGGAIFVEPGGQVTVSNCLFRFNSAFGSNGVAGVNGDNSSGVGENGTAGTAGQSARGGAIFNAGELTVLYSTFFTNTAEAGNGGDGGNGGHGDFQGGNGGKGGNGGSAFGAAIYNIGTVSIDSTTFAGNLVIGGNGGTGGTNGTGPFDGEPGNGGSAGAASGGGLYSTNDAIVVRSTFSDNSSIGGSSANGGSSGNGVGNSGPRGGEGSGAGFYNSGTATMNNCTFFANSVIGGNGGNGGPGDFEGGDGGNGGNGLGAAIYGFAGDIEVINCTVAQNQAIGGTNGVAGSGPFRGSDGNPGLGRGGVARGGGTFFLQNSILVTNAPGTNAYGTITDGGNNISSDASLKGNSRKRTDPKIGGLADNGGPTKTMKLLTNSPAIDTADDSAPDTDQRGIPRPIGPASDVGAYEASTVPIIQAQPQSQVQTNGGSVTFRVTAVGESLTYQWRFYGTNNSPTNIAGATSSSYTITFVGLANVGKYDVRVSNPQGSVTSQVATLSIGIAPTITLAPTNQTGVPGSNVTFFASASGDPPLAFQWRFNGTNIVGATTTSYTITNVQPANAGEYAVSISNHAGVVVSSNAVLFVDTEERFTISGHVFNGGVGESGVTVTAGTNSALTDPSGAYTIFGVHAGEYFVFAEKTGLLFVGSQDVTLGPSATNVDFTASEPTYNVSGRVTSGGVGVSGVIIYLGRTTDSNGVFQLPLTAGTYDLVPSKPGSGLTFSPSRRTVTVPPDATNQDFIAGTSLSIARQANGNVVISVGGSGRTRIETSTNLLNWVSSYTNFPPFSITNTPAPDSSLFYRSVQP
jgi:hypothetical protein